MTLTFLFTDLEGSTRLWEEHPTATRELAPLVEQLAAEIDAARVRAAAMSYDDAVAFIFDAIDRLIAEHGGDAGT